MSIVANKETRVVIQGGPAGVNAARRMAEFCHLTRQPLHVLAFVFPPDAGKTAEVPFGSELVSIPIFKTMAEATAAFPALNTTLILSDRIARLKRRWKPWPIRRSSWSR
ncbi:MAG: hypothetical protein MPW14_23135 [Candidatus Manganitrophus sp.]|nr:MAG: hypothetical protein MPW17_06930 [Candidatus Manganitrophus sp.]WDT79977.1 MAG: hypothetical protein MPW14_23135 [Candidatus Manganitrophus sp.]